MTAPTVFISYSHQDEAWMKRLLPQLHALEQAGIDMHVWHDRKIDGGEKWYPEILDAMANSAAAVLLISPDFLASKFCVQEEVPALLKRQETQGLLLVPVLLRQCVWKAHRWLRDRQMLPRDGKCVANDFSGDHADAIFAAVAEQVLSHFQELADRPAATVVVPASVRRLVAQRTLEADHDIVAPAPVIPWPPLPEDRIDLTRLPETGSALFGRDRELALLDEAWASPERAGTAPIRILAFTAHGGVGKSTLVNHWLAELARDRYRGASRVFGWSFYSQGVRGETTASADTFIDAALRFFGDSDPTAGSSWDKGSRLAGLVGSQCALLVLDGLEPLQSAQAFERGELRDPAIESLLRGLARQSAGLCVITTREPLAGLGRRPGVTMRDLEQIDPQAGRALLRTARVVATDAKLEALATKFGPHALAVSLLGVYLREQPGHGIGPARALDELPGDEPIDRVLAGFEQWLGDGPEREALRLLGLFDRPADAGCLRALRMAPAVPGLTDRLVGLDEAGWDRVLARLEDLRLIHVQGGSSGEAIAVDAHPLIREHFAELLKGGETWRAAHRRLYEHLCATTKEGDRPTLEDLQPLYQAVAHGCQAGMQLEAFSVLDRRIGRFNEKYPTTKLGAFGSDLGGVACFFEQPWNRVSPTLTEAHHGWLLHQAAFRLRALGRLTEALEPMRAAVVLKTKQENWEEAAIAAGNLSELELTLGEVAGAVGDAEQSVTYADRSRDAFQRMSKRTTHADALRQAGRRAEAQVRFREAEAMQAGKQPDYPLLYSLPGFRYCDLLLSEAERRAWRQMQESEIRSQESGAGIQESELENACRAVSARAAQTLQWVTGKLGLLDEALDHLTLGRAALYGSVLGPSAEEQRGLTSAATELDAAVAGLRRAGQSDYLPRGLLTRAWCSVAEATMHRLRNQQNRAVDCETSAQRDLDEAWDIAERGPMPLFLADIHLYRARLFHAATPYPWATGPDGRARGPRDDLADARRLIEKHGYWRWKEELEDAEAAARNWPPPVPRP